MCVREGFLSSAHVYNTNGCCLSGVNLNLHMWTTSLMSCFGFPACWIRDKVLDLKLYLSIYCIQVCKLWNKQPGLNQKKYSNLQCHCALCAFFSLLSKFVIKLKWSWCRRHLSIFFGSLKSQCSLRSDGAEERKSFLDGKNPNSRSVVVCLVVNNQKHANTGHGNNMQE